MGEFSCKSEECAIIVAVGPVIACELSAAEKHLRVIEYDQAAVRPQVF